jgi:hypothetical protein
VDAAILEGILAGNIRGPKRDLAIVNAAGAFVVAGLANYMASGIELAREQIDSGRALEKFRPAKLRRESFRIAAIEIAQQGNGQVVTIYRSSGGHCQ